MDIEPIEQMCLQLEQAAIVHEDLPHLKELLVSTAKVLRLQEDYIADLRASLERAYRIGDQLEGVALNAIDLAQRG